MLLASIPLLISGCIEKILEPGLELADDVAANPGDYVEGLDELSGNTGELESEPALESSDIEKCVIRPGKPTQAIVYFDMCSILQWTNFAVTSTDIDAWFSLYGPWMEDSEDDALRERFPFLIEFESRDEIVRGVRDNYYGEVFASGVPEICEFLLDFETSLYDSYDWEFAIIFKTPVQGQPGVVRAVTIYFEQVGPDDIQRVTEDDSEMAEYLEDYLGVYSMMYLDHEDQTLADFEDQYQLDNMSGVVNRLIHCSNGA